MCVVVTSDILGPTINVLITATGPNLVCTFLLSFKCCHRIYSPHLQHCWQVCLDQPCQPYRKSHVFVQKSSLHVRVNFFVVSHLAVALQIGKALMDRFVKEILREERRIVFIRFAPWQSFQIARSRLVCRLYHRGTQTVRQLLLPGKTILPGHCYS